MIAAGNGPVKRPRDLDGHTAGVTGLPSDEAVVDSEVSADGGDPAGVQRVTIGFNAVASLAAAKVDAATGFCNAEGVALRRRGIPIRVFKVNEYGAPPYPELVLVASRRTTIERGPSSSDRMVPRPPAATPSRGRPARALDDLLDSVPTSTRPNRRRRCAPCARPPPRRPRRGGPEAWSRWDVEHGLLERPVVGAFDAVPRRTLAERRAGLAAAAPRRAPAVRAPSASEERPRRSRPPRPRAGYRRRRASRSRAPAPRRRRPQPRRPRRGRRRSHRRRLHRRQRRRPRPRGRRRRALDDAAREHQVGDDCEDPGHQLAERASTASGAGGTLRGRSRAVPTSARPPPGPRAPRAPASRRRCPRRRAWRARP